WGRRDNERAMPAARSPEIHKALADDTRFRLYRYVPLVARPVSVTEMSARLALHPNTIRPHLRRLEEAGLVTHAIRKGRSAGPSRSRSAPAPSGTLPMSTASSSALSIEGCSRASCRA